MNISIIIPNWNGADYIESSIESLLTQSMKIKIIVVDNGSTDESLKILNIYKNRIEIIRNNNNLGFAGGVNVGMRKTLKDDNPSFIGLLNNDAIADSRWIENLLGEFDSNTGIVTSKILHSNGLLIDSTGEFYTNYGLTFSRGRDHKISKKNILSGEVFGASGGASLYSVKMLKEIGLFDEDFFAYYEDVDLSFRARLAGWNIKYCDNAKALHRIGATSKKIKGFTTYQTMKNLPWLLIKNVPLRYLPTTIVRFSLVYMSFLITAGLRGDLRYALKGLVVSLLLLPKKLVQRYKIQSTKKVSSKDIWALVVKDLPENAHKLRRLRRLMSLGYLK